MATLTISDVPDDLLARLRQFAEQQGSELDAEVVRCLAKGLSERELIETELAEIRTLREQTRGAWLTDDFIRAARIEGRA